MPRYRTRRYGVGSKEERLKWRGIFFAGIFAILGLATMSTHPTVMEAGSAIKSKMPRQLMTSTVQPAQSSASRILFDEGDCIARDELCIQPGDCDAPFENACCILGLSAEEDAEVEPLDTDPCTIKDGTICRRDELCVAELIPGSGVGAECLSDFETDGAGGALVYLFLLFYLFVAVAIVCDDYFTYALDMLGDFFKLSSSVKGATFAAIGSSAPELFVSLADNVIANPPKSVGVGTIVGSAIFNILVIIGASAVTAARTFGDLKLDWRPLMRDSLFYILSIVGLIVVVLTNDEVEHYEGAILVILYLCYLAFMFYNDRFFVYLEEKHGLKGPEQVKEDAEEAENKLEPIKSDVDKLGEAEAEADAVAGEAPEKKRRGSALGKGLLEEEEELGAYCSVFYWPTYDPNEGSQTEGDEIPVDFNTKYFGGGVGMWLRRAYFIFVLPINVLFRFTIPDARYDIFNEDKGDVKDQRKIGYWAEFTMCIVWIAVLSHFLVFSAAKFGCIVGIDPAVMGLTVLAAGTSVPDMITSVILTKNGEGDAAVANSIGSNVFDILIGLGFPWLLAGFIYGGSSVESDDLNVAIPFLFGVLIILLGALAYTKFHLNQVIGIVLLGLYVFYVIFELAIKPQIFDDEE